MDEIKTPALGDQPDTQGSDKKTELIVPQKPVVFSVGGDRWKEVPNGEHSAVCSKVMPDFAWRGIPKLMLYFIITEGFYRGYRARLSYNYNKDRNGPTFGARSKFDEHAIALFPEVFGDGLKRIEFDPIELFIKKFFRITTEIRGEGKNAMVQKIELDSPPPW